MSEESEEKSKKDPPKPKIDLDTLKVIVKRQTKPVIVALIADWSKPCEGIKDTLTATKLPFVVLDINESPDVGDFCEPKAVPALFLFSNDTGGIVGESRIGKADTPDLLVTWYEHEVGKLNS